MTGWQESGEGPLSPVAYGKRYRLWTEEVGWFVDHGRKFYGPLRERWDDGMKARWEATAKQARTFEFGFPARDDEYETAVDQAYADLLRFRRPMNDPWLGSGERLPLLERTVQRMNRWDFAHLSETKWKDRVAFAKMVWQRYPHLEVRTSDRWGEEVALVERFHAPAETIADGKPQLWTLVWWTDGNIRSPKIERAVSYEGLARRMETIFEWHGPLWIENTGPRRLY